MKFTGSLLAVVGMIFSSFACSPLSTKNESALKAADTFYDYSLSFDSLLNSSYFENPTVLKPIQDAAKDKENVEQFRAGSEWFIVDSNVRLIKVNNGSLSVGGGDIPLERRDPKDFTPALSGDKNGNSKGWPNDQKENPAPEAAADSSAWRNQLDYAVKSTLDSLQQFRENSDRDRAREDQARENDRAARAKQIDADLAKMSTDWVNKLDQDRAQLGASIQADIARSNQEVANARLVVAIISAPIDANTRLSNDLAASKSQAQANFEAQLANNELDLIKQKRQEAASNLEKALRDSEVLASSVTETSGSDVIPLIKSDGFKTSLRSVEGVNVRDAAVYVRIASSRVESAPASENKEAAKKLIAQSHEVLETSDEALAQGDLEKGSAGLDITYALADAAVALAPLGVMLAAPAALPLIATLTAISFAKDFYEVSTGRHLFSGKELSVKDRGFAAFGVITVLPIMKAGRAVGSLATRAGDAARLLTALKKGAAVAEAAAEAVKAAQIALDAAVRAGIDVEKGIAAFARGTNTLKAAGFEGDVVKAVRTVSNWDATGGTSSMVHVLLGNFHNKVLTGGMHTFQGLKYFFSLNPAAQAALKVEVASNGVGRLVVPVGLLSNKAAANAESVVKTLFPESWSAQKIIDAVDHIAYKTLMKEGRFSSEMVVDGVNIRVIFNGGKISTAFPIFPF